MAMGEYVKKMKSYLPEGTSFVMASSQVVVMNDKDEILITKRADNGKWDIPGGGCEETDSYKQTAVKEMKEELNIDVLEEDLEFLGTMSKAPITIMQYPGNSFTKYYTCIFGVINYKGDIALTDGENLEYKFVMPHEAIESYDLIPSSKYILEQLVTNNIPFID